MLATFALVALSAQFYPDWNRMWTVMSGPGTEILGRRGDKICYSTTSGSGVVGPNGQLVWFKSESTIDKSCALGNDDIFTIQSTNIPEMRRSMGGAGRILARKIADGTVRQVAVCPQPLNDLLCDDRRLFVAGDNGLVVAFDQKTGKPLWRTTLGEPSLRAARDDVVYLRSRRCLIALDARSGKRKWSCPFALIELGPNGILIEGGSDKIVALDAKSGRRRWQANVSDARTFTFAGNTLVTRAGETVYGLSLADGKVKFHFNHEEPESGRLLASVDGQYAWVAGKTNILIDQNGETVWTAAQPLYGAPSLASRQALVFTDTDRILGYSIGKPVLPPGPEYRKRIAEGLVSIYEKLDDGQRDLLVELAPYATAPLLDRIPKWIIQGDASDYRGDQATLSLLFGAQERLLKMATKEDAPKIMEIARRIGITRAVCRDLMLPLILKNVSPDMYVPQFLKLIQEKKGEPKQVETELELVAQSKNPGVTDFLLAALEDPRAPSLWRREAFIHLPGSGDGRAFDAVLAARAQKGLRPHWSTAFHPRLNSRVAAAKDGSGREWGLFHSRGLGTGYDLYAVTRNDVVFLGPDSNNSLLAKWLTVAQSSDANRDQDGDLLTDLVEKRLGTSPVNPDMDGDGLKDSVDPCPNAAPRALGDREKIVAAAVEAYSLFRHEKMPTRITVPGMKPFELYGYPNTLMWGDKGGLGAFSFAHPSGDKDWLELSADGSKARTLIAWRFGDTGEADIVDLVKKGDEWFVTNLTRPGDGSLQISVGKG